MKKTKINKSKPTLAYFIKRLSESFIDEALPASFRYFQTFFTEKNNQITFTANFTGLKPGIHAIHIHEKSDCSAADGSSAGGHWNPTFKKHGKLEEGEAHKGDIGNFTTDEFGNGNISYTTSEWCIGCDDKTKDIVGKSLIVHQGPDDYVSQPAGNSGARVACSAIIK